MKIEVDKFKNMTQELAQNCQVKYIPSNELPMNQRLYGQGTLGYDVLGIKDHPQCQWIAMDELKFIDYLRKLQHQEIAWSKYSYNPAQGNGTIPVKVTKNQSYDKNNYKILWQNHIQNSRFKNVRKFQMTFEQ